MHLCATDISFISNGCLMLHLKSSKTDPYCQGCFLLIAASHRSVWVVHNLPKVPCLASNRQCIPSLVLPVWQPPHQSHKVTSILRTLLQHLGIPIKLYASHSFRIGATTSAAEAGLPPWLIQTLRQWSSNCFTIYIRTPPSVL